MRRKTIGLTLTEIVFKSLETMQFCSEPILHSHQSVTTYEHKKITEKHKNVQINLETYFVTECFQCTC